MTEHVFAFTQTASHVVTVEHDGSREEAEEKAWKKLPVSLCHQCSHKYDMAGDWVLEPEEEDE